MCEGGSKPTFDETAFSPRLNRTTGTLIGAFAAQPQRVIRRDLLDVYRRAGVARQQSCERWRYAASPGVPR